MSKRANVDLWPLHTGLTYTYIHPQVPGVNMNAYSLAHRLQEAKDLGFTELLGQCPLCAVLGARLEEPRKKDRLQGRSMPHNPILLRIHTLPRQECWQGPCWEGWSVTSKQEQSGSR